MTAQELREKLFAKLDAEFEVTGGQDFASSLIAIICSQREALEFYKRQGIYSPYDAPISIDDYGQTARMALSQTDEQLEKMGVL